MPSVLVTLPHQALSFTGSTLRQKGTFLCKQVQRILPHGSGSKLRQRRFPLGGQCRFIIAGGKRVLSPSCRCPRQTGLDATRHLEFHPSRQPPFCCAACQKSLSHLGGERIGLHGLPALPHCSAPCRGLHPKPVPQPAGQHPPAASGLSAGQGHKGLVTSAGNRLARTAAHWSGDGKKFDQRSGQQRRGKRCAVCGNHIADGKHRLKTITATGQCPVAAQHAAQLPPQQNHRSDEASRLASPAGR